MCLPDFTAEASLYRSDERFVGDTAQATGRGGAASITVQNISQGIGWRQWGGPLPHTGGLCLNGLPPVCDDEGHCACPSTNIW
jgi:hypothetical protein